jgi:3-methyladenine DNA glycosylase AlkD
MMLYDELLNELNASAENDYKLFTQKLLKNDKINVLGVRIPKLRQIAKKYREKAEELINLPDEFYEVTFVKLCAVAYLPYDRYTSLLDECVKRIDNWCTCDSFIAKCVENNRDDFLKYVDKYLSESGEFYQRFALVCLLHYYVEEKYLPKIFECVNRADTSLFYVHMAAAWLIAEVLAKHYDKGVEYLLSGTLDKRTHNKAIQKATESYRISEEDKKYLKTIKR